jgi:hypothetical protein
MILPRREFSTGLITFSAALACGVVLFPRSPSGRRYHSPHRFKITMPPGLAVEFGPDGPKPVDDVQERERPVSNPQIPNFRESLQ